MLSLKPVSTSSIKKQSLFNFASADRDVETKRMIFMILATSRRAAAPALRRKKTVRRNAMVQESRITHGSSIDICYLLAASDKINFVSYKNAL